MEGYSLKSSPCAARLVCPSSDRCRRLSPSTTCSLHNVPSPINCTFPPSSFLHEFSLAVSQIYFSRLCDCAGPVVGLINETGVARQPASSSANNALLKHLKWTIED